MKILSKKLPRIYNFFSITDNDSSNPEFVYQKPFSISVHKPEKKYLLLSSDAGYFNRVTQFISGNVNSLLFLNVNGNLESPTLEEVISNPQKYFMIYPIPATMYPETNNQTLEFQWESNRFNRNHIRTTNIDLTFELGLTIGRKFFAYNKGSSIDLDTFESTINGSDDPNLFWPHKNLILNSNIKFILGILFGYLLESLEIFSRSQNLMDYINSKNKQYLNKENLPIKERLFIKKNDNSYIFSTMLNWLGASYSFQNIKPLIVDNHETTTKLHISLPFQLLKYYEEILEELEQNPEFEFYEELLNFKKLFKTHEWFITTKNKVRRMPIGAKEKINNNINKNILDGKIRLLPMTSFKIIESKENINLYDFTMPRADATNYAFAFTPMLKNSDGDILTLSAIYGDESIEDAQVFKPAHKEWFRNLNDGNIKNYISDDAILGLFAATKHL